MMGVADGLPMLVTASAFMGMTMSVVVLLLPYLVTRFFGQRASAEILGLAFACSMVAIGCGPLLIGLAFDASGSYNAPMMGAVVAAVLAAGLMATLSPKAFKVVHEAESVDPQRTGQGPFVAPKVLS